MAFAKTTQDDQEKHLLKAIECFVLYAIGICLALGYDIASYYAQVRGVDYGSCLLLSFDKMIPFTDLFIFFYFSSYITPKLLFLYTIVYKRLDVRLVRIFVCVFGITQLCAYAIFVIVPTSNSPLVDSAPNVAYLFFPEITRWFNTTVMPLYNAFPSLHVATNWICILYFYHITPDTAKFKSFVGATLFVIFILVLISTVTLKYHYLFDLIAGYLLAEFMFYLCFKTDILRAGNWSACLGQKNLIFVELAVFILVFLLILLNYDSHIPFLLSPRGFS